MSYVRPEEAQIISNNAANAALNRVIVIPLTSQVAKIYPGEALVTLNGEQRKVMADQVTTASKRSWPIKSQRLRNRDCESSSEASTKQISQRLKTLCYSSWGCGARIHACASMGRDSRPQRDH